jgi:hypothetical protein
VKARWQRQEISATEAGKILGCTHNTFLKWVRKDAASDQM